MRQPASRHARGSTLLVVIILVTVLLGLVATIMMYAGKERIRAVAAGRSGQRQSCAESGLQLARSYFGRNFAQWNTFLSAPSQYDPVRSSYNLNPANPKDPALRAARPELFGDVDGDGEPDVYLYIRDNADERFPLTVQEWNRDNDQNVVVGAICISSTLTPRRPDGTPMTNMLAQEGLLKYSGMGDEYESALGGSGTGYIKK
jgi:hypothetical protein